LYLRKKRKPFLKKASDELVELFESKRIFPTFSNDTWQHYRKVELKEVLKEIYQAEPKVFVTVQGDSGRREGRGRSNLAERQTRERKSQTSRP